MCVCTIVRNVPWPKLSPGAAYLPLRQMAEDADKYTNQAGFTGGVDPTSEEDFSHAFDVEHSCEHLGHHVSLMCADIYRYTCMAHSISVSISRITWSVLEIRLDWYLFCPGIRFHTYIHHLLLQIWNPLTRKAVTNRDHHNPLFQAHTFKF